MSKLADLQGRMKVVSDEMGALALKEDRSADDETKLDSLLAEFNDLGPAIIREQDIQSAAKQAAKAGEGRGAAGARHAKEGAEEAQRAAAEYKSIGQRFVESDHLEAYKERGGGPRSEKMGVGSFYHNTGDMVYREGDAPIDVRALVHTGAMPNSYIQPTYVPGFFRGDDLQGSIRSVLLNGQTNSDAIVYFRETAATNAAAAVAEASATTGTTGLKPESGLTFEEATANVKTIATWIPITRQMIWDAPALRSYIEGRLMDFLRLEESDQLLNGDGTGANLLGLRNAPGVQVLDSAAFTTTPVNDAGEDNENFNRILRARMNVRTVGRARANFVVLNPADLEQFLTSTDGNKQYFGAGPFSGAGIPNLWGMTVVEDENQPAKEALVGDGRMAQVWDRMQAQILIDTINDQFVRNMLTILAEERLALAVYRSAAFAKVALV